MGLGFEIIAEGGFWSGISWGDVWIVAERRGLEVTVVGWVLGF